MNPRFLIQPLDILSVKLIGTHNNNMLIDWNINSGKNDVTLYHNLCGKKKALNNIHFSWAWSITFSTFLASDSKHKTNCDTPLGKVLVIKKGDRYKIWLLWINLNPSISDISSLFLFLLSPLLFTCRQQKKKLSSNAGALMKIKSGP